MVEVFCCAFCFTRVPSVRIELTLQASEACVLSVERRGHLSYFTRKTIAEKSIFTNELFVREKAAGVDKALLCEKKLCIMSMRIVASFIHE